MKITNIGTIKSIDIELGNMTVLCGDNNTGKTFASYIIYSFISKIVHNSYAFFDDKMANIMIDEHTVSLSYDLIKSIIVNAVQKDIAQNKNEILSKCFKFSEDSFIKSDVTISESEILDFVKLDERVNSFLWIDEKPVYKIRMGRSSSSIIINVNEQKDFIFTWVGENSTLIDLNYVQTNINIGFSRFLLSHISIVYFPSERVGLNVFRDELNEERLKSYNFVANILGEYAISGDSKKKSNRSSTVFDKYFDIMLEKFANYPLPISNYLEFINEYENSYDDLVKYNRVLSDFYTRDLLNGKFVVDKKGNLLFHKSLGEKSFSQTKIPFHMLSSSQKALFGIDYYITKTVNKTTRYLFIDEPELNLHPTKQIILASFLSYLSSNNYIVFLATHSDYIIRKLANISLQKRFKSEADFKTKMYLFSGGKSTELDIRNAEDMMINFDNAVNLIDDEYFQIIDGEDNNG